MNPEAKPAIPPCASVLGVEIEDDDSMVEFFEKYLQGLRAKVI